MEGEAIGRRKVGKRFDRVGLKRSKNGDWYLLKRKDVKGPGSLFLASLGVEVSRGKGISRKEGEGRLTIQQSKLSRARGLG